MRALFILLLLIVQGAVSGGVGGVQGVVTRVGTTEGLADIEVDLISMNYEVLPKPPLFAKTNNAGQFAITNVPAGRYRIQIQSNGFSGAPSNIAEVTVPPNRIADIPLEALPAAVIRGHVLNSSAEFVSNTNVQLFSIVYENGFARLLPKTSKLTDDRGEYRLFGIVPGEYYVGVTPRLPLANPTLQVGTVRDVRTYFPSTDNPATATPILVKGGEEITGIDIVMRSALHVRVSGRVVSQAPPAAPIQNNPALPGVFGAIANAASKNVQLQLVPRNPDRPFDAGALLSAAVLLTESGEFEIPNVPAGAYDLYASAASQDGPAMGRVAVDVGNNDVTGITVVMRNGVDVKGTVSMDSGPATRPVGISLQPVDSPWRTGIGNAFTGGRGVTAEFIIRFVPQGRYRIAVSADSQYYVDDILQNGRSVDSGFDVDSTAPDPIQVVLKSGAGSISGTVVDAADKSVSGGIVALVPMNRRENPARYKSATADAMGRYALVGIPPGDYILLAWPYPVNGAFMNAAFLSKYEESGHRITVSPNGTTTIRLALSSAR